MPAPWLYHAEAARKPAGNKAASPSSDRTPAAMRYRDRYYPWASGHCHAGGWHNRATWQAAIAGRAAPQAPLAVHKCDQGADRVSGVAARSLPDGPATVTRAGRPRDCSRSVRHRRRPAERRGSTDGTTGCRPSVLRATPPAVTGQPAWPPVAGRSSPAVRNAPGVPPPSAARRCCPRPEVVP
ncbi:hypothetical protein D3C73_967690 [compost metagenome]